MKIVKDIALAPFSSFGIGGCADFFCSCETRQDLKEALQFADKEQIPFFLLGGGSNIVFSDMGFRGIVIHMCNTDIQRLGDNMFLVESGVTNANFYAFAQPFGSDYSDLFSVPGTIGGAIFGNAGIPRKEIGDILVSATVFDRGKQVFQGVSPDFFQLSYRSSIFHGSPEVRTKICIWDATLRIPSGDPERIIKQAKKNILHRQQTQPWGKTGGSFFKNHEQYAAGFCLDSVGMKGVSSGGVFFSQKHANFMMNNGSASQKDVITLARKARKEVFQKFQITLVPEVRLMDEWGNILHI